MSKCLHNPCLIITGQDSRDMASIRPGILKHRRTTQRLLAMDNSSLSSRCLHLTPHLISTQNSHLCLVDETSLELEGTKSQLISTQVYVSKQVILDKETHSISSSNPYPRCSTQTQALSSLSNPNTSFLLTNLALPVSTITHP